MKPDTGNCALDAPRSCFASKTEPSWAIRERLRQIGDAKLRRAGLLGMGRIPFASEGAVPVDPVVAAAELQAKIDAVPDRPRRNAPPKPPLPRGETSPRRRGQQIASGKANLPAHVVDGFADCGRAVLGVIAETCGQGGPCLLTMGEIAYQVGCTVESVRLAMRKAERRMLIRTVHRRQDARRNLPNLVTIACDRWRTWIARGLKGAARRAGAELREKAQATARRLPRWKDDRAAAVTLRAERRASYLRGEAEVESLRGAAARPWWRTRGGPKPVGGNPEPSLQDESPAVASQLWEENCPSGSSISGVHRYATPTSAVGRAMRDRGTTVIDGTAVRWS